MALSPRHSKLLVFFFLFIVLVELLVPVYSEEEEQQQQRVENTPSRKDNDEMARVRRTPCNEVKKDPRKVLRRLRHLYLFVNAFRLDRENDDFGNDKEVVGTYCPFKRVEEDTSTRGVTQIPQFDVKAICPNCCKDCKPVYYKIRVLQNKGCDKKIGDEKWIQVEKKIPVAYVYNPDL